MAPVLIGRKARWSKELLKFHQKRLDLLPAKKNKAWLPLVLPIDQGKIRCRVYALGEHFEVSMGKRNKHLFVKCRHCALERSFANHTCFSNRFCGMARHLEDVEQCPKIPRSMRKKIRRVFDNDETTNNPIKNCHFADLVFEMCREYYGIEEDVVKEPVRRKDAEEKKEDSTEEEESEEESSEDDMSDDLDSVELEGDVHMVVLPPSFLKTDWGFCDDESFPLDKFYEAVADASEGALELALGKRNLEHNVGAILQFVSAMNASKGRGYGADRLLAAFERRRGSSPLFSFLKTIDSAFFKEVEQELDESPTPLNTPSHKNTSDRWGFCKDCYSYSIAEIYKTVSIHGIEEMRSAFREQSETQELFDKAFKPIEKLVHVINERKRDGKDVDRFIELIEDDRGRRNGGRRKSVHHFCNRRLLQSAIAADRIMSQPRLSRKRKATDGEIQLNTQGILLPEDRDELVCNEGLSGNRGVASSTPGSVPATVAFSTNEHSFERTTLPTHRDSCVVLRLEQEIQNHEAFIEKSENDIQALRSSIETHKRKKLEKRKRLAALQTDRKKRVVADLMDVLRMEYPNASREELLQRFLDCGEEELPEGLPVGTHGSLEEKDPPQQQPESEEELPEVSSGVYGGSGEEDQLPYPPAREEELPGAPTVAHTGSREEAQLQQPPEREEELPDVPDGAQGGSGEKERLQPPPDRTRATDQLQPPPESKGAKTDAYTYF